MNEAARRLIDTTVVGSPMAKELRLSVTTAAADAVSLSMPFADSATTTPGIVHGGVIATLIDTAGAAACASGIASDDVAGGATTHLSVIYLRPATTDLTANAQVVHRTRTTTHTEVVVVDEHGSAVARGQLTSRIFYRG